MMYEFEAAEFISAIIEHRATTDHADTVILNNAELNDIAYRIVKAHPSIRICLDRYSIETFRRQCPRLIEVERDKITITHINSRAFSVILKSNLPAQEYKHIFTSL